MYERTRDGDRRRVKVGMRWKREGEEKRGDEGGERWKVDRERREETLEKGRNDGHEEKKESEIGGKRWKARRNGRHEQKEE